MAAWYGVGLKRFDMAEYRVKRGYRAIERLPVY
jgi:hypothetical protein